MRSHNHSNLSNIIREFSELKSTQRMYRENDENYQIVQIPKSNKYYAINQKHFSNGAFGMVYMAYPIDIKDGNHYINKNKKYVAKIASQKFSDHLEAQCLKTLYKGENPIKQGNKNILIYKFLEGYDLGPELSYVMNPYVPWITNAYHLSFKNKVKIIKYVSNYLFHLHQKGIAHRDIKISNIRFSYNQQTNNVTAAYLIDFGLAADLKDTNPNILKEGRAGLIMAPEMFGSDPHFGLKSDIFSFAAVILSVFNANNPLTYRIASDIYGNSGFMAPWNPKILSSHASEIEKKSGYPVKPWQEAHNFLCFDELFVPSKLSAKESIPNEIKDLIIKLVYRMTSSEEARPQRSSYKDRPDSEEIFEFFKSLDEYLNIDDKDKKMKLLAKLKVLAVGAWSSDINLDSKGMFPDKIIATAKQQQKATKLLGIPLEQSIAVEKNAYLKVVSSEIKQIESKPFDLKCIYFEKMKRYRKETDRGQDRIAAVANIDQYFKTDDAKSPLLAKEEEIIMGCIAYEAKQAHDRHFAFFRIRVTNHSRLARILDEILDEWLKNKEKEMPYVARQAKKQDLIDLYVDSMKSQKSMPTKKVV